MSLRVAAELTGITKGYLSKLENGQAAFSRRGLIEDLAEALGCSPADLTGGPNLMPDRRALDAASAIPALTVALHDIDFDDLPDLPIRPVQVLAELASRASVEADEANYPLTGPQLGELITELHVAANRGPDQQTALVALVEACIVARFLAATLGHDELAVTATHRGWMAARRAERPDLIGLMAMGRGITLNRVGARRRASGVLTKALADLDGQPGPTADRTEIGEARGMLHLTSAHLAARAGAGSEVTTHIDEAESLARFTGERNHMNFHFGPANVLAWKLAVAVETGNGPEVADQVDEATLATLGSKDRRASVHFDLARAYAQDDSGCRDHQALQHLDAADRIAPVRVRQDPIVRELVLALDRRTRSRAWMLSSIRRRVGIA